MNPYLPLNFGVVLFTMFSCIEYHSRSSNGYGVEGSSVRLKPIKALTFLLDNAVKTPFKKPPSGKKRIRPNMVQDYKKPGDYKKALKEFDSIKPTSVKDIKTNNNMCGKTGLVEGYRVTVRSSCKSYPNRPTIEFYDETASKTKKTIYKIRYMGYQKP